MNKKNETKLCWNCEGNVSLILEHCPYCGANLVTSAYSEQVAIKPENPFQPPYKPKSDFAVSDEEWKEAMEKEGGSVETEQARSEMIALLLLLPGIVFLLFGLALILFSHDGVLTLQWNQSFAYFYFLGAVPLLIFGWKALR